jgi:hypothetical protein
MRMDRLAMCKFHLCYTLYNYAISFLLIRANTIVRRKDTS